MQDEGTDQEKNKTTGGLPAPETPAPTWPPAPRLRPPEAALAARRTLTPLAWVDAALGLPGGVALAWLSVTATFAVTSVFSPAALSARWLTAMVCLALVVAALLCAAACRVVGRRFPVFAVAAAVGTLPVISLFLWIYWPRG